jgi:hypothetical protein
LLRNAYYDKIDNSNFTENKKIIKEYKHSIHIHLKDSIEFFIPKPGFKLDGAWSKIFNNTGARIEKIYKYF